MDIKLSILDKPKNGEYKKPMLYEYHGNYALEIMIFRISEIYFGIVVSKKIEEIINRRIQ
jgi:hypothetical protein